PEIEVKDYKGVEIETVNTEVTDEAVDEEIKSMSRKNSRMITVDRPAKDGDMVLIDYEGWVGDNQFEGGTAERQPLKLGSGTFIPGFEEQLIGVSTGEDKDVKVTFPEEYHAEDLAGKEAVFKCKVHEIKEEELPEINDDFVKDVSEFDTLDELKADVREKLVKEAADKDENQMKNSAIEKVFEANDIDVPDVMVESEIENMMSEFDQQLRSQGMDLDSYFKYMGTDSNSFKETLKDEAFKKVKTRMIISAIAEQEKFEATDDDVQKEIESMAQMYGLEADKVKEMLGEQNIKMISGDIKLRKAIDYIYDNAVKK
ncbi:MAG: trigger factor, partial [Anaerovoracaceae bacterium]